MLVCCAAPCPARVPSDEHGFDRHRMLLRRPLADQLGETWDRAQPPDPILQVTPEVDSQLPTGLLQAGKRIPATTPRGAARAAADLALLDIFADIRFRGIVVQRHLRPLQ